MKERMKDRRNRRRVETSRQETKSDEGARKETRGEERRGRGGHRGREGE